jgi:transposase
VDLGLKDFAVLSTGERIANPPPYGPVRTGFTSIAVEDLNVSAMVRNRRVAKSISGTRHDRDHNAAKNILVAAGLAETRNACGGDVRP